MTTLRYTGWRFSGLAYGHRLDGYGYPLYWEYSQESLEWLAAHIPEDKHRRSDLKMRRAWEAAKTAALEAERLARLVPAEQVAAERAAGMDV